MGKRIAEETIDEAAFEAAIQRFVAGFVIKTKRERALLMLRREHGFGRIQTLQKLPEWVDPALQTELGRTKANAALVRSIYARFGSRPGVLIDERGVHRVTMATGTDVGSWGALFISDDGEIAVLSREIGPPVLCARSALHL